jgi:hypothetical protein
MRRLYQAHVLDVNASTSLVALALDVASGVNAFLINTFARYWSWYPGRCGDAALPDAASAGEVHSADL